MSNEVSVKPSQTVAEIYSGVHASTALNYAKGNDAARHPAPGEAISALESALQPPVWIELPHIDVVLSISAKKRNSAHDHSSETPALNGVTKADLMCDPIIERLLREFNFIDKTSGEHGVYRDAIRLAVLARWLGLSSSQPAAPADRLSPAALPKWRLKRVTDYIDKNLNESLTLAELARAAGLSKMYFAAQFRAATGLRPHEYVLRKRIDRAKILLAQTGESLVDIALAVGFQTQAHFTTVFKRIAGETPRQWRCLHRQVV